ncbi:MAG: hypothetical protein ABIS29_02700 [Vicinamibacterales bacterium]
MPYRTMTRVSRERSFVLAATAALVVFRSLVFVLHGFIHFNSDQAIVGLMAKHLSELRALPVYFYGQHYMLAVEAWAAALVFLLTGPTVWGLNLALLGFNVAVALLLVYLLERDGGLRPLHAFVAALFFLVPPPGTTMELMNANGGNIEPFLYVLLLWVCRRKPLLFGALLAVGVLNREFTLYGLAALIVIEVADGALLRRSSLRPLAVATVAFAAVLRSAAVLDAFGSPSGPGTITGDVVRRSGNADVLSRVCVDLSLLPPAFYRLLTSHLGQLFGGRRQPLASLGVRSFESQGIDGLWPLVGAVLVAALAGFLFWSRRQQRWPWQRELQFGSFLLLTGGICAIVRVLARCGELDIMRYTLLSLLAPIGIVALFVRVEPSPLRRRAVMAVVVLWAVVSLAAHGRLLNEQMRGRVPDYYGQLTEVLMDKGVAYARANYWVAYHVTFLSREQLIVDSADIVRIKQYRDIVNAHSDQALHIERQPCREGVELVAGFFYACP